MAKKTWLPNDRPTHADFQRWEDASETSSTGGKGGVFRVSTTALSDNKRNIETTGLIPSAAQFPYKVHELVLDLTTGKLYQITEVGVDGKAKVGTSVGQYLGV